MLININFRTNRRAKILAIVKFFLLVVSIAVNVANVVMPSFIFNVMMTCVAIINLLLYTYMITVLVFFAEKRAVVIAFVIYLILDAVGNVTGLLLAKLAGLQFGLILGVVVLLATIYLFIVTMLVKSAYISFPFKFFAFSILAEALLKILVTLILPQIADSFSLAAHYFLLLQQVLNGIGILWLVMPISIILIARGTNDYIETEIGGPLNSLSEMEETY